jgi:D-aminopeptidase
VVKQATSRYSADSLTPVEGQAVIRRAAEQAVAGFMNGQGPQPLDAGKPVKVAVEFMHTAMADGAVRTPGSRRVDARKVEIEVEDMAEAYRAFRTLVAAAG